MRTTHLYLAGIAIATLGVVIAAPVFAQDSDTAAAMAGMEEPMLDPTQQAQYDSWPDNQRTAYAAWPSETKSYYWSLEPEKQALFWRLSDDDKVAMTAMTGSERDAAWSQIESRAGVGSPDN
ncbi:MAG: hypothetical protein V2J51_01865 [Erythrobacter sp.]|jgi:hypothetical protein|nr:hypothetical protein [Erythrobacter sp.]